VQSYFFSIRIINSVNNWHRKTRCRRTSLLFCIT